MISDNQEINKPKFNRKEYMKTYCKKYNSKKYHSDPEYKEKQIERAKKYNKYERKTQECKTCDIRCKKENLNDEGRCLICI